MRPNSDSRSGIFRVARTGDLPISTHRDTTTRRARLLAAVLAPIVVLTAACSGGSSGGPRVARHRVRPVWLVAAHQPGVLPRAELSIDAPLPGGGAQGDEDLFGVRQADALPAELQVADGRSGRPGRYDVQAGIWL